MNGVVKKPNANRCASIRSIVTTAWLIESAALPGDTIAQFRSELVSRCLIRMFGYPSIATSAGLCHCPSTVLMLQLSHIIFMGLTWGTLGVRVTQIINRCKRAGCAAWQTCCTNCFICIITFKRNSLKVVVYIILAFWHRMMNHLCVAVDHFLIASN